jgi:hypothetical protein
MKACRQSVKSQFSKHFVAEQPAQLHQQIVLNYQNHFHITGKCIEGTVSIFAILDAESSTKNGSNA